MSAAGMLCFSVDPCSKDDGMLLASPSDLQAVSIFFTLLFCAYGRIY